MLKLLPTGREPLLVARLTEELKIPDSLRGTAHTFVETDHKIFSTITSPSTS